MNQAINAYYTITASSEFQETERLRAKARHDEAQALSNARHEAKFEIARSALQMGMAIEDIARLTGLTQNEIKLCVQKFYNKQKRNVVFITTFLFYMDFFLV